MTTDDFTTAARAEAESWIGMDLDDHDNFVSGAEWARTHLAAQEVSADEVRKAQIEALRETRNAFYRKYQFTPPLLDDGRNPSPDEHVGARHAVNVAMAFIVEQMDKIEDGEVSGG